MVGRLVELKDKLAGTTTDQFDRAFTGRVGLVYLFENGVAPYASYTTSFQPTAGTSFSGTPFSYLDSVVTKATNGTVGKTPLDVPSYLASLWGNYKFGGETLAGLSAGAGIRYVGATYGDNLDTIKVPGFTIVDAAVRYDLGHLNPALSSAQIAINVNNLFDKKYLTNCTAGGCWYGLGRTILGTVIRLVSGA